jgi:uncharacterized protein YbaP (TraB family)
MNQLIRSRRRNTTARLLLMIAVLALATARARAEPSMWVVKDKDSTIYLIGTLHLLRHAAEWDSTKVKKAVAESTTLYLEIADPENADAIQPLMQKYGFDGQKLLSAKLTPAGKEKLTKLAAEYNMPMAGVEPMRPWMAALLFAVLPLQKAGYDPNAGVDLLLRKQAEKEGDQIQGFETMEEQVRLLAGLPEADQIAFLEETLDDASEGIAMLDKLAKAWMAGDNKTINDLMVDEVKTKAPAIYEKILVQRNMKWSGKIADILSRSGVQMIAVGAGHLVGADSVQAQLAKRGIKAEAY